MAAAGAVLVKTLNLLAGKVRPGVTTRELDEAAEKFIRSQGAEPAFKGYRGFPGSICASPNSMIVHGIPGAYKLARGDILSVDVGVILDGWVADAARTFPVGPITPVASKLLTTTEESLLIAVDKCRGGQPSRRRVARHPGARRGSRAVDRALAGRPRDRPQHARGAPDPQLRQAGDRDRARRGDGARGGADGHGRPPRDPGGRRPLVDLLAGWVTGGPFRVHDRDHGRRTADFDPLARGRKRPSGRLRRGANISRCALVAHSFALRAVP